MREILALVAGWAAGAATMYYLDPHGGRRRRAVASDKLAAWSRSAGERAQRGGRHVLRRVRAAAAAQRARWHAVPPRDDEQLRERVRARIGRAIRYPGAIDVEAADGRITLRGPVLAEDVPSLLDAVRAVSGVVDVENRLEVHDEPGNVPELQGARVGVDSHASLLASALAVLAVAAPTAIVLGTAGAGAWRNGRRDRAAKRGSPSA
ncbi:MAG TPA: BON domain-containing protein [Zeimonas sp.]|nr:BON domain-containing protein [Zeimonas sp.]